MELWVKIGILALCSLWYYSFISPPTLEALQSESFSGRHSFSITFVVFHSMGWSGLPTLPVTFFIIQAITWGTVLFLDLYLQYGLFFLGVKLLPPLSVFWSVLGIPLICLVMYTPSAYLAMMLSNIVFRATVLPPYTDVILNISPDSEANKKEEEEEEDSPEDIESESKPKGNNKSKRKAKKQSSSQAKPTTPDNVPVTGPDYSEHNEPTLFLMTPKISTSTVPYDISMERARYATIDTLFLLPFLCTINALAQQNSLFSYPNFAIKFFGIPSSLLAGYITVPFCGFLLFRHFEATALPKFTYFLSSFQEFRYLQFQLVLLVLLGYGSQLAWLSTLTSTHSSSLPILIPVAAPLVLTSFRYAFHFFDTPDLPIPIDTQENPRPHQE